MKKTLNLVAFLTLAGLLSAVAASAEEGSTDKSTRPPRNLKKVGDHWTPWEPPPAGPDDHIIQKGDTLWDLGQQWLGNPFLWPQIWDQNRYIQDSHWIYPGDPIVKPGKATVVPPGGPLSGEAGAEEEGVSVPSKPEPSSVRTTPKLLHPLAMKHDVYCSGYVDPDHVFPPLWVAGREIERIGVGTGDVVYLNQGRNQGIEAGMDLAVQRKAWPVRHPATQQDLGSMIVRLGRVRVLCSQENTAVGAIMDACEPIHDSDELVPWTNIRIPDRTAMPPFDRHCEGASGGAQGYVVVIKDRLSAAGTGHIIHTDLGQNSGVRPGDSLTLYRDNGELPRLMIGQAMILTVEPGTSTAKVTLSVRELAPGDRVEVSQSTSPARASR